MTAATTTSGLTAAFVAEARRHYVPAVRWARANGWTYDHLRRKDRSIEIHTDHVWSTYGEHWQMVVLTKTAPRQVFNPTSLRRAVAFLIVAGILPPLVIVDCDGDRWSLRPDGRYTYTYDDGDTSVMTRDDLDNYWGPVSAVQS